MSGEPPAVREHRCSCGRVWAPAEWDALPSPPGGDLWDDGVVALRLRNCACGSTMAQPTLESAADVVCRVVVAWAGPVVEEPDLVRRVCAAYGFDEGAVLAGLAFAVLREDLRVYESPRADAPPGTKAYRRNYPKERPF